MELFGGKIWKCKNGSLTLDNLWQNASNEDKSAASFYH